MEVARSVLTSSKVADCLAEENPKPGVLRAGAFSEASYSDGLRPSALLLALAISSVFWALLILAIWAIV